MGRVYDASACYEAIQTRHGKDMVWGEVKDGPTHGRSHRRLDALAIVKTWSPVRVIGYEIKVSRSDWTNDHKWTEYLPLVTEFWLVCPKGLVTADELPDGVGLAHPAGSRLITDRKAVRLNDLPDPLLLLYLLMNRVEPAAGFMERREDRIAAWKARLAADKDGRSIGYAVAYKTAERLRSLERAATRSKDLAELDAWLNEHDPGGWGGVRERLDRALREERTQMRLQMRTLVRAANRVSRGLLKRLAPLEVER